MTIGALPDAHEFDAVFDEHYGAVLRYAQRRADPQTAQDVAAEVMVIAWRRLNTMPADARPWLMATARRVLANQRRSQSRLRSLRSRLAAQPAPPVVAVDDLVATQLGWAHALLGLSPSDQEVLTLIAWDGLTSREAAASLGCSTSAFTTRLSRARTRLIAAHEQLDRAPAAGFDTTANKGHQL